MDTPHPDQTPRWRPAPPATPAPDQPVPGPPPSSLVPPPPPPRAEAAPPAVDRRPLSRRRFIGVAGGVAGAAAVGGGVWASLVRGSVDDSLGAASTTTLTPTTTSVPPALSGVPHGERVLVVIEMAGGNDALNTLVPADGVYRDARPALAVPEADLVALSGTELSLHPSLAPLVPLWDDGCLAAVAGVGMTEQSRSHFKAMDTWWSAVNGAGAQTGWLGRWLDATLEGENDPLRAIALGGGQRALVGTYSLATVVQSPQAFSLRTLPGSDNDAIVDAFLATAAPLSPMPELAAAQDAIPATLSAVDLLASVSGDGEEPEVFGRGGGDGRETAADLLQTAAGIIDLGIGTRVITVGMGGFDTHANQYDAHAALLADVGGGLAAFVERLEADGNRDKVMIVTTSEFGRRVDENGSAGTDHGNGGLQFVCGPEVAGATVVGEYALSSLDRGDLPTVVDTRGVYAAALDWLGGPTDEILGGTHDRMGLLGA